MGRSESSGMRRRPPGIGSAPRGNFGIQQRAAASVGIEHSEDLGDQGVVFAASGREVGGPAVRRQVGGFVKQGPQPLKAFGVHPNYPTAAACVPAMPSPRASRDGP